MVGSGVFPAAGSLRCLSYHMRTGCFESADIRYCLFSRKSTIEKMESVDIPCN